MRDVKFEVDNYIQTLVIPVSPTGTGAAVLMGKHSARELDALETAYFEFVIPKTVKAFKEAGIRIIPTTTGSINYTVNFQYGAVGASHTLSSKTAATTGKAVTNGQVMELDLPVTTFFTDLEALDQLAVEFVADAFTTTTKVNVLNLVIKYI